MLSAMSSFAINSTYSLASSLASYAARKLLPNCDAHGPVIRPPVIEQPHWEHAIKEPSRDELLAMERPPLPLCFLAELDKICEQLNNLTLTQFLRNGVLPEPDKFKEVADYCTEKNFFDALSWLVLKTFRHSGKWPAMDFSLRERSPADIQKIEHWLKKFPEIASLNFGLNKIGSHGATAISNILQSKYLTLKSLYLDANRIGNSSTGIICNALMSNKTLTLLDLSRNHIEDDGAIKIAILLQSNKTLAILNLQTNKIGAKGATDISKALLHNSTLTTLDLYENLILDTGAQAISDTLNCNSTLTSLDLRKNYIGDDGYQAINRVLQSNETLCSLKIQWRTESAPDGHYISHTLNWNRKDGMVSSNVQQSNQVYS